MQARINGVILAAMMTLTASAQAERPTAAIPDHSPKAHARCAPTGEGNVTPPSPNEGETVIHPERLCPPGQAQTGRGHAPVKHGRPHQAIFDANSDAGYYYVADGQMTPTEKPQVYEAWFSTAFSNPNVPANATNNDPHSDVQDWISNDKCVSFPKVKTLCTLELGWAKTRQDQVEGWPGPEPFCFYTADNYSVDYGPCSITYYNVEQGGPEDPFAHHYYPTDGTPGSKCGPNAEVQPCTGKYEWRVKQSKGAWWIWTNVPTGKGKWVGRVSDHWWGYELEGKWHNGFTLANEVEAGGEVHDWSSKEQAPVTQMGNGNKGSCVCATNVSTVTLQRHRTAAEGGGTVLENTFFDTPVENENWPVRYTSGTFTAGRMEAHLGG